MQRREQRPVGGPDQLLWTGISSWDGPEQESSASVRVEAALKESARILLRGEAGSGKTTLLNWLAVTAARGAFGGDLADWNGLVPVLVKPRRYASRELPRPEELLDATAGPLTGHMPRAWMDREFQAGRVLLLVDGVDELVAAGPGRGPRDIRGMPRRLDGEETSAPLTPQQRYDAMGSSPARHSACREVDLAYAGQIQGVLKCTGEGTPV
ncbi:NACHT domain-containing protein [Streptomyces sp. NEAU-174]|uniref:NACHT domain-containing protein n=1 Tax=Streptomyces sp. NEAU-174 TaxID=3458254 RepID=UPI004044FF89